MRAWERVALRISAYRQMSLEDWLCDLGIRGCELHIESGFFRPIPYRVRLRYRVARYAWNRRAV